ncbi:MAG: SufS family cysteine desulfurase [Bacteroidales bacterium]|nr:SufS family cysteine desulfurase [Bacteroidales bacterium]
MTKVDEIRKMFPALQRKVYGKPLVYLDNAATTQRPQAVIDRWVSLTQNSTANIHRAVHTVAAEMTEAYEAARESVRAFINAGSREEVVFTSGTTASINLVAFSFGEAFVHEGDEIIISEAEHHSNIVPWQLLCERKGAVLKVLPVDETGHLVVGELDGLLSERTKIVAVSHISNVLGLLNPVREVVEKCHAKGVPVLLDGAQAVVHQKVDVRDLDCDFYVFSGHKMFAATGTGVLYGKKSWMEQMPPYMSGGEMIGEVKFSGTTFAPLPQKFEAGTQNFTNAATFVEAIECVKALQEVGDAEVVEFMLDKLLSFNNIRLFGQPSCVEEKAPVFSFAVEGAHHEDLALLLDKMGIAVRSGQMCAEPLMDRFGVTGMVRASFAQYNTLEEAEYFISSLQKAIDMLV